MAASKKKVDTTLVVLREIRDAVKGTNVRLDETNTRLDALERRQGETEIRMATELTAVSSALRDVVGLIRDLRDGRIASLEERVTAVERKVG